MYKTGYIKNSKLKISSEDVGTNLLDVQEKVEYIRKCINSSNSMGLPASVREAWEKEAFTKFKEVKELFNE